eukprot:COSAG04_NODE_4092_length_2307_cov_1.468750_1_plen_116_part_10
MNCGSRRTTFVRRYLPFPNDTVTQMSYLRRRPICNAAAMLASTSASPVACSVELLRRVAELIRSRPFSTTDDTPEVRMAVVLNAFDHSLSDVPPIVDLLTPEVSATLKEARAQPIS